ncbi:ABC transporter permease [Brachybacterium sp. AOP42-C2-15]|uniref:ABC transporter permease n=1 Tax=unclassified Brachybacterium TaxID=2623841 RepID=UPI003F92B560
MTTLAGLIMLSVLLACAGTGLITRLVGSGDALIERADAPHLAQLHTGDVDVDEIADFAADRPEITAHQVTPLLGIDGAQLFFDGASQSSNVQQNSLVVPSHERDLLLGLQDRPIIDVEPGTIWLPLLYEDSGLAAGSTVTLTAPDGFRLDLEVAGFLRDSSMGPAIAGSKRLAVSAEDLAAVAEHTGTWEHLISFWVQDRSRDLTTVRAAYQEAGLPAAGPSVDRSAFILFTVFAEGLVAALVLLAAGMVLVIGMLTLRLALRTALARDRREIAVMTAIGISARDVRTLHLLVYGTLAGVAGALGLLGSIALERVLSSGLTRFLGETGGVRVVIVPALAAMLLVLGVLAMVAGLLRRLRRIGPLEVLRRSGSVGDAAGPGRLRLRRSPLPVGVSLGLMSLLGRGSSAPLLVTVFAVCTLLVMVPTSIATTLSSPQFSAYFGLGAADVRIDLPHTGKDSTDRFESARRTLADDARVAEHTALVTTRHLVETDEGEELGLAVSSGDRSATPGIYTEGRAPRSEVEIALSLLSLAEAGVSVGDQLPIQVQGQ